MPLRARRAPAAARPLPERRSRVPGGRALLPLGVGGEVTYRQAVAALPTGSIVVLYTDGLIERRDRSLEDGLRCCAGSSPRAASAGRARRLRPRPCLPRARAQRRRRRARRSPPDRSVGAAGLDASVRAGRAAHGATSFAPGWSGRRRRHRRSRHRARDLGGVRTPSSIRRSPAARCSRSRHLGRRPRPRARARCGRWRPEQQREERGLGLRLMRSLMESVEVDRRRRHRRAHGAPGDGARERPPVAGRFRMNRLELELDRPNGRPVVVARLVGELDLATVGEAGPQVLAPRATTPSCSTSPV